MTNGAYDNGSNDGNYRIYDERSKWERLGFRESNIHHESSAHCWCDWPTARSLYVSFAACPFLVRFHLNWKRPLLEFDHHWSEWLLPYWQRQIPRSVHNQPGWLRNCMVGLDLGWTMLYSIFLLLHFALRGPCAVPHIP